MMRAGSMLLLAAATVAAGCGGDRTPSAESGELDGTILVAAAASLTDAFDDVVTLFEAANPGVDVEISIGGSSSLAVAIEEGSPIDVFASASDIVMNDLRDAGQIDGEPVVFATNSIAIAVPVDSEAVTSLDDFSRDELFLGACAPQVPCGSYADELFSLAGINPALDTREPDVRALVTKLLEGELDAGIVYASDIVSFEEELDAVALPDGLSVEATYPIAVVADAPNPAVARSFVEFVAGAQARSAFERAGFGTP